MYGVVCLSILLEGGVRASNNVTKWRQNGLKVGARDKFATHLRQENFISNEPVFDVGRNHDLHNITMYQKQRQLSFNCKCLSKS